VYIISLLSHFFFFDLLLPEYNILPLAGNSLGYKHTDETKLKMIQNYSKERKDRIKNYNLGKSLSIETKKKISLAASNRTAEQRQKYRNVASKPIEVF